MTWIGYKAGWFSFGSDLDESMWGAGLAFLGDAIVTVAATLRITPKPEPLRPAPHHRRALHGARHPPRRPGVPSTATPRSTRPPACTSTSGQGSGCSCSAWSDPKRVGLGKSVDVGG